MEMAWEGVAPRQGAPHTAGTGEHLHVTDFILAAERAGVGEASEEGRSFVAPASLAELFSSKLIKSNRTTTELASNGI